MVGPRAYYEEPLSRGALPYGYGPPRRPLPSGYQVPHPAAGTGMVATQEVHAPETGGSRQEDNSPPSTNSGALSNKTTEPVFPMV